MLSVQGQELLRRVRAAAEGTPYAVTETERGFDVRVRDDGTHTVTEVPRPGVGGRHAADLRDRVRQHGRIVELGAQRVWTDAQGRFGVQADFRSSAEEGRQLVTGPADEMGLGRGAAEEWRLVMGFIGAVGGAVTAVVLVAMHCSASSEPASASRGWGPGLGPLVLGGRLPR